MTVYRLTEPQLLSLRPPIARRQLRGLMEGAGWSGDIDAVLLAVHEAMVNSQRHGGGLTRVSAGLDAGALEVEVCDRGPGFELAPGGTAAPDPDAERGRGLWIMQRVASRCRLERGPDGMCVRMRFEPA